MLQVYDARKQGLDAKDIHLKYIKKINVRECKNAIKNITMMVLK